MKYAPIALLALVLTSCGGNGASVSPGAVAVATTPVTVAEVPPDTVTVMQSTEEAMRSITVGGIGSEYAAPVRCVVDIGVDARRSTVNESTLAAYEAGLAMTDALQAAGVDSRYIQTSDFSVGPYYDDWPNLAGYETVLGYRVTIDDVEGIGGILAKAIAAGGDTARAWGIRWEADHSDLIRIARAQAWEDVMDRADSLASLAGETLGELLDAHEKVLVSTPHGMYQGGEGDSASFDIPAAPGQTGVVVLLTVTFAIGD